MDTDDPSGERHRTGGRRGRHGRCRRAPQELRASLDAIVSEAERLSEQLIAESRAAAAGTTREAEDKAVGGPQTRRRAAADAIRARAEAEVEEHRRRVRAEVAEQVRAEVEPSRTGASWPRVRAQSQAVIGDLEASVRILGVSLESAVANIAEMLSALEAAPVAHGRPDAASAATPPTPADRSSCWAHARGAPGAADVRTSERRVRRAGSAAIGPAAPSVFDAGRVRTAAE